jgi:hypothetical protein
MGAESVVSTFASKSGAGVFKHIRRADVAKGVRDRLANPGKIDQNPSSLCGPASLLFCLIKKDPFEYARYVTQLYDGGLSTIGGIVVRPSQDTKDYDPAPDNMDPCDWVALASLRDSENAGTNYQSASDQFAGITMPIELSYWLDKAGFKSVQNVTSVFWTKSKSDILAASTLHLTSNFVCLFINADMLYGSKHNQRSIIPNHWVVLTSPVNITGDKISMEVFTWGNGKYKIPESGELTVSNFCRNFYGYVSCKG